MQKREVNKKMSKDDIIKDIKDIKEVLADTILNEPDKKFDRKAIKEMAIEEMDRVYSRLYKDIGDWINTSAHPTVYCGGCRNLQEASDNLICEKCGFDNTKIIKEKRAENWKALINKTAKLLNTTPEKAIVFIKKQLEKIVQLAEKRQQTK